MNMPTLGHGFWTMSLVAFDICKDVRSPQTQIWGFAWIYRVQTKVTMRSGLG